jgi:hypothetical protein
MPVFDDVLLTLQLNLSKTMKHTLWVVLAVFLLSSCSVYHPAGNSGKVPPGQAKKMTGSKSAKKHAPGQRKKGHH